MSKIYKVSECNRCPDFVRCRHLRCQTGFKVGRIHPDCPLPDDTSESETNSSSEEIVSLRMQLSKMRIANKEETDQLKAQVAVLHDIASSLLEKVEENEINSDYLIYNRKINELPKTAIEYMEEYRRLKDEITTMADRNRALISVVDKMEEVLKNVLRRVEPHSIIKGDDSYSLSMGIAQTITEALKDV
ncbi:MAG: hypothetical protein OEY64_03175 [Nitrospinota bacterium]|nr:hypothetical protein [Nitrospinota bacterium]